MFKIFTQQGKPIINCEFYSAEDASEYAQLELNLQPHHFTIRQVGFSEQQAYTKEDF